MSRLPIAPLLLLAGLTTPVQAASPPSAPPTPEPIATRQTIFCIPFEIEKVQRPDQAPAEVRLYVSTDRGASWQPYTAVQPSAGHFLFRAVGDGEYWFLVRTIDRAGKVRPEGPAQPELRVVVDTTPPNLQLEAARGNAGQIIARWQIGELALKPDSLKIQYRDTPGGPWQSVAVPPQDVKSDGPTQTGQVTWWPPAGAADLQIRAEVADLAGNAAVSHQQIKSQAAPPAAPGQQPGVSDVAAASQDWHPARGSSSTSTGPVAHPMATPATRVGETVQVPPSQDQAPPPKYPDTRDYVAQHPDAAPNGGNQAAPQTLAYPRTQTPAATDFVPAAAPPDSVASTVNPPVQNQFPAPAGQQPPQPASLPAEVKPRTVNSRVFELEYETGPAAPGAIARVELWGTRDDGRTWTSFGQDVDGRSPMLVSVADQGVYGFRVVAGADPRTQPPQPRSGERPDFWIDVDLDKPTAAILSAEPGTGPEAGKLVIRWQAADHLLAPRPVSLFYGDVATGGWSPIAAELENTGVYAWTPSPQVPAQVKIRLEVRDAAGNLATIETPQPVAIAGHSSGAHIRDVRPVPQTNPPPTPTTP